MSESHWQHKAVIQTLYSGRCTGENAGHFDYGLAQARSDVFFTLLFGGTVTCSAASFFDSPIAIRVFGELLSTPGFKAEQHGYVWLPLRLYADSPNQKADNGREKPSIRAYLYERWTNPNLKLCLFRELDLDFGLSSPEIQQSKKRAADSIAVNDIKSSLLLGEALSPIVQKHLVGPSSAKYDPILMSADDAANWITRIIRYVEETQCFDFIEEKIYRNTIAGFRPLHAIITRTNRLAERLGEGYMAYEKGTFKFRELAKANEEYKKKSLENSHINVLHTNGRKIYSQLYPLVVQWMEADWHGTRRNAYEADACLYSTNWEAREIFDFDKHASAHYLEVDAIDDSLRLAQEKFGMLDWTVLLQTVSDFNWTKAVMDAKTKSSTEAGEKASLVLLNLLARKINDFNFNALDQRLTIVAKNTSGLSILGSAVAFCLGHYDTSLQAIAAVGAFATGIPAGAATIASRALSLKGVRWTSDRYKQQALRTAIQPKTYLGYTSNEKKIEY